MTDFERGYADGARNAVLLRENHEIRALHDEIAGLLAERKRLRDELECLRAEPCAACRMRPRVGTAVVCEACR